MERPMTMGGLLLFCGKFCLFVAVLAPLWWLCIPAYGWLMVQACGSALKWVLGMPITAGRVDLDGILNTGSRLVFYVEDRERVMKFALLVTNLPPFVALVLATPALTRWRRLRVSLVGSAVLVAGHALYILLALRFGAALANHSEFATAVSQFFLTLPFLLWLVLAYWGGKNGEW